MAKSYDDLSEKEQSKVLDTLDNSESLTHGSEDRYAEYGLCAKCKTFMITKTEFETVRAECIVQRNFPRSLSAAKPVVDCNAFENESDMELWEMRQMAYYLDGEQHRKAGFITDDD